MLMVKHNKSFMRVSVNFSNLNIPWEKVIAFNSDICSVMKGHCNGVINKMRAVNPQIVDVGCICYIANLAVGKSLNKTFFNVDELICDMVSHFKSRFAH